MSKLLDLLPEASRHFFEPSEYGPLSDQIRYATYACAAASALYILARGGGRKWQPTDTEVPQLSERTAVVVGAVASVVIFALLNNRALMWILVIGDLISGWLLVKAYREFRRLSGKHLFKAPHLAKGREHVKQLIIGDEGHLTSEAIQHRDKGVSLVDLIAGCGGQFDKVFESEWRRKAKVKFEEAYFKLVLLFIITLAATGQLLSIAAATNTPPASAASQPASVPA